jgi:hypothetical protein
MDQVAAALVGAVVGALLGFGLGRLGAHWENKARRSEAVARHELDRIARTRDFYIRLIDWYVRRMAWRSNDPRILPRPRFSETPDVNLAVLANLQLTQEVNEFLREQRNIRPPVGDRPNRRDQNVVAELEQRLIAAADTRAKQLLEGSAPDLDAGLLADQARYERIEEVKLAGREPIHPASE